MRTNDECIQNFMGEYSMRLELRTLKVYTRAVDQMLVHCMKPFGEINSRDIRSYMQMLDLQYSSGSVRYMMSGVRLFYTYCVEEDLISQNPVASIKLPELEERLPYYLQNHQLTELRKLVEGHRRERAIIEVMYTTGVRIGELESLKKEDIVWSERIIYVRKGKRKKDRIVLFTRSCAELLQAYLQERQDNLPFVFVNVAGTGPVGIRSTQRRFTTYSKELSFTLTPHTLRHTLAAHLAMKGMPLAGIQSLLGHTKERDTQLYARLFNHVRKQMYDEWM